VSVIVVPDVGEVAQLQTLIDELLEGAKIHLFDNDFTPGADAELGDFTESSWTSYAAIDLAGWSTPAIGVDDRAHSSPTPPDWLVGSGGTGDQYGYYVTDAGETTLLFASRFDSAPSSSLRANIL
jgi:hypothetical protein